jgi:cytochrome c oxidase subunit 3
MTDARAEVPLPYDDRWQLREAATLGMWVFLAAELIFFGGVFVCYGAYAFQHGREFAVAANRTNLVLGAINTAVLLSSSWTMALAVHAAHEGRRKSLLGYLLGTAALGTVFLTFKGTEYLEDIHQHLLPGSGFRGSTVERLYFSFYFVMTGIHALHLVIGITLLLVLAAIAWRTRRPLPVLNAFEISGLYWHFVDIVWIFLFPLLYLRGRHL